MILLNMQIIVDLHGEEVEEKRDLSPVLNRVGFEDDPQAERQDDYDDTYSGQLSLCSLVQL